jgi:hypothetical protein
MTLTRANVADYLDEQFSSLATAVGQDVDVETGYKPDIDNALRKLSTVESDLATATVADGSRDALYTLAEYYAARRLWRLLGDRVNNTDGLTTYNFDSMRKQVKEIMEDARKQCAILGYDVSSDGWTVGNLNLDWLEPEPTNA